MSFKKFFLTLIIASVTGYNAHALIELKVGYGALASTTDLGPLYSTPGDVPGIVPQHGLVADLIVSPPLLSWGFGLRTESLGLSASSGDLKFDSKMNRTSALVSYRLIDTLLYLGPVATFGLTNKLTMKIIDNGTEISNFSSDKSTSYSIGIEGGVKLVGLLIGGELGYQSLKFKDADDTGTANMPTQDIDLSGTYLRVGIGFGF